MNNINTLPPFKRFCVTIGNLPSSYVDSMSYYECLMWLCKYLKDTVIPSVNENAEAVNELINWFNNLDVQEEINNKLDEMAEDGSLTALISAYLDPIVAEQNANIESFESRLTNSFNTLENNVSTYENNINSTVSVINSKVERATSGSPAGVYATVSALTTADPDHSKIYLVSADGEWYYYATNSWVSGGVYQATQIDSTTQNEINNNKIKLYYGLDGIKNKSLMNGATETATGLKVASGSTGFSSFIVYLLNFSDNSRLKRFVGKTLRFTIKFSVSGDITHFANVDSEQLKLRSFDGTSYSTVLSDQTYVTTIKDGNTITKYVDYTIPADTKYLGSLLQLMTQTNATEETTITVIENTYEVIDTSVTKNTNALEQVLAEKGTQTNLHIRKDGFGDFSTIKACFDYINSKADNSQNNIYNVYIHTGEYNVITEQGGTDWLNSITIANGQRQGLTIPNYTRLIGIGDVVIKALIPAEIDNADANQCVSLFNTKQWNEIYNIHMISQNVRYTVHDEASGDFNETHRLWKNCIFERLTGRTDIFSTTNYGAGMGSGGNYQFENCIFLNDGTNLFIHNNNDINPNNVVLDGCCLKGNTYGNSVNFGYLGNNTKNSIVYIKNCMYENIANLPVEADSDNAWSIYNFVDGTVTISGEVQ